MKNSLYILFLFVGLISLTSLKTRAEAKNKQLLGEWLYEVTEAPNGYEKGSLIFSEKDGQLICLIKLEAGELAVSNLKIEKEKITFTTVVEGNQINVELNHEKNKLTGKVDSPEGPKILKAIKK